MPRLNPYDAGTPEHRLWEGWNSDFFQQPMHAQLYETETRLRTCLHGMMLLASQVDEPSLRWKLQQANLKFETEIECLHEIAEHAFTALVTKDATEPVETSQKTAMRDGLAKKPNGQPER